MSLNVIQLPVPDATAIDDMDVRLQLRTVLDADKQMSQQRVSKEIGLSTTTISQWLGGTYPGDVAGVEAKVRRWLETYTAKQARAAAMPMAPGYVETPSSQRVIAALRYAQVAGDIAVIYGGAGLGKTSGIQRYAHIAPSVFVATMTPASSTVVPALQEIAEAVGASVASGGAATLHRAIVRRIENTNGLLVIEESQHLSTTALDQVRSLHDATGIGIAFVGNEEVYARMTGGNRAAYLDRLFSRVGKKLRLIKAQPGDVNAILDAWHIDDAKGRVFLSNIASKPGGLRILTKVLRLASMYAAGEQRALSSEDVRAAWNELGGVE